MCFQGPVRTCPCGAVIHGTAPLNCAECAKECPGSPCPVELELSADCTDQCIVVPCNDAHHDAAPCPVGTPVEACEPCSAECPDLDQFFQCCSDYHGYLPDPMFQQHGLSPHTVSAMQSMGMPHFFPDSEAAHSPQPQALPYKCQWAGCPVSFTSLGELVGHVNLQHLRLPPASELSPAIPVSQPVSVAASTQHAGANPLSCLWADCQIYPTPQSVPGPSSGNAEDTALGILASHLLEDHLGLHMRASKQEDVCAGTEALSAETGQATSHDCSAPSAHDCKWTGCAQTFASCDALTAHITAAHVGSGRAHYDCYWEGCARHGDNGFSSKQKILRHLQSHTGHRPFQCKICKQNFSEAATLAQHMRRHTQEKPYVCDFPGCGKAFAITGALTIHKRTHNGHKPFKCSYCERAFAESSNLSKHLRTHTGARPYSCTEPGCNKSFARPDQLTRHQNVHRKKQQPDSAVILGEA
ncbi:hypothetical protein POSPLADRAFT_1137311 [Postia placenta MAD-698-R-SB12]|uniref:C2H2-type domain-containing protein n=1 Tax=Postia placenta MAD-698-R-SB12 TaxID=670580 RepID=A0A1X6N6N3_9APHY|nr:hypothetical protein POSPLADRAFT_1137311 [Postia placenta MAD-698-R-SB12]OSX64271.1 hypothetical protein POSPLADRAFT_1137311 [Postia placenta MAD-698-R-SB12]